MSGSFKAVAAARFVEELVGRRSVRVVLAGDFDADPDAASVRFWSGRQSLGGVSVCYRDTWESANPGDPGHTFTPNNPLVADPDRSEEHTSELQSRQYLVCRLLLEKKK